MNKSSTAGALSVFIGAVSYGMPGVILSLATRNGATVENLIPTQFLLSFILFFILSEMNNKKLDVFKPRDKLIVLFTGIPLMCITYFFYKSVQYIGVPTATLLMMQSAWIAPVMNCVLTRKKLSKMEVLSFCLIMAGVLTATGILSGGMKTDFTGIAWGLAAGVSYSLVILSSSHIANGVRVIDKAKILTLGAFVASVFLFNKQIDISPLSVSGMWSAINAIFSSILPVLLFGFGMPRTKSSLAGMLVTTELPAAFLFSYLMLADKISPEQIVGCIIMMLSIVLPGIAFKMKTAKNYSPRQDI